MIKFPWDGHFLVYTMALSRRQKTRDYEVHKDPVRGSIKGQFPSHSERSPRGGKEIRTRDLFPSPVHSTLFPHTITCTEDPPWDTLCPVMGWISSSLRYSMQSLHLPLEVWWSFKEGGGCVRIPSSPPFPRGPLLVSVKEFQLEAAINLIFLWDSFSSFVYLPWLLGSGEGIVWKGRRCLLGRLI